jgi:hypothetical protein
MTTVDDDEPTQGNWLMSQIKNSKVAARFSETILCRIGIHQGTWTTEGRQQRRFCIYCGIPQQKITATSLTKLKCLLQMHEGGWTTDGLPGCWQRYRCKYCGVIEQRERHIWPDPHTGEYFEDGSCETRVTCLRCGKTESTGKMHEGQISWWNNYCKRCGEYLGVDGGH